MFHIFRKKNSTPIDLSGIVTDMHSHLLPGIDDGSPDTATSLELIRGLQELGIQHFITTPHILWDLYRNNDTTIGQAQTLLESTAGENNFKLPLRSAAEYMIDDHFSHLLSNKTPLRKFGNNFLLVEFSFLALPLEWKRIFFDLQILGYQPVLAHPERYTYLNATRSVFTEIAAMGVLLQVNLNSLTGYYGKTPFALAQYLVNENLVAFVGTDLHHHRHLEALQQSTSLMPLLLKLLDSGRLLNTSL